jgi:predicted transcriptional regulator
MRQILAYRQPTSSFREGSLKGSKGKETSMPNDEIRFRRRIEEAGYSILYHVLTLDGELSDPAFRLYSLLLKYAQQKDYAYPGVKRLAEDLGKSEKSVKRALAELGRRGLISRQRRFGTSTITYIEDPNEVYGDLLAQMCEGVKNDPTGDHDGVKNDPTDDHEEVKNDLSLGSKMTPKEKEDKKNKRGEEEEEASIWQAALGELQLQMTKATFDTWVRNTRLVSCRDGIFVIGTQNEFARDWLENRLLTTVKRTLVGIVGHPVEVRFVTMHDH